MVHAAAREGDERLFLDGGRPVERLLRALVHTAPLPYAQRLVRAALAQDPAKGAVLGLSKRELEVARYLPTPLSSAEIAARLYISLNTLKTHLRTIYGKLDATNRREAIQRAEELGIA